MRPALALALATVTAVALFTLWPGLDLAVAALFHDATTGTWVGDAPFPALLRDIFWRATELSVLAFALLLGLSLMLKGSAQIPARLWAFALASLALGPGLLVNGVLKAHWGRARPRSVTEFGGQAEFTPALQITDQCAQNCSFVSGEVAGLATLALVLWLIAARGAARPVLAAVLTALTLLMAALRIAAGGHFLSDAVFAVLLSAGLTLALWRLLVPAPGNTLPLGSGLTADLRAARSLAERAFTGRNRPK